MDRCLVCCLAGWPAGCLVGLLTERGTATATATDDNDNDDDDYGCYDGYRLLCARWNISRCFRFDSWSASQLRSKWLFSVKTLVCQEF